MRFPKVLLLTLAVLSLAAGCKKDDDDTSEYFAGSISLKMDTFVEPGYTKTFCVDTLSRLLRNEDGDIGYYYVLPGSSARDTVKAEGGTFTKKTFTAVAPDSLSTFKVSYSGFARGYYDSTGSASFTVVKVGLNGKGSLTNYDIAETDGQFVDERDGRSYYYTSAGDLDWMRQNLAWEGSGVAFDDCKSAAVSTVIGRFYTWDQAVTACPDGWRLPADADWAALAGQFVSGARAGEDIPGVSGHLMENVYMNRERLWEYWREVTIDNKARFSALPMGYATVSEDMIVFEGKGSYALFWTSDEDGEYGGYRYIFAEEPTLHYGLADKSSFAATVRCVRDREL